MSGRGRGGRGGHGAKQAFSKEQLLTLGISNKEVIPGPVTQPPPLYPLLNRKPVAFTISKEYNYLLILKEEFIDQMQLSGAYLRMPDSKLKASDHELDKLVAQLPNAKEKFDWNLLPSELRPRILAKRIKKSAVKEIDIDSRLNKLEQLEEKTDDTEVVNKANADEDVEEEIDNQEEEDEEMDDGTDYANNYFDNGEGYEDDDDNLDDGPIY